MTHGLRFGKNSRTHERLKEAARDIELRWVPS
jgi:hypothetical protein